MPVDGRPGCFCPLRKLLVGALGSAALCILGRRFAHLVSPLSVLSLSIPSVDGLLRYHAINPCCSSQAYLAVKMCCIGLLLSPLWEKRTGGEGRRCEHARV